MADTPTFGRYTELSVEEMSPEQQAGYRLLVEGARGRLPGPYRVWVHNPKLVHALEPIGTHFTPDQSSLSEREREIAVLVPGRTRLGERPLDSAGALRSGN